MCLLSVRRSHPHPILIDTYCDFVYRVAWCSGENLTPCSLLSSVVPNFRCYKNVDEKNLAQEVKNFELQASRLTRSKSILIDLCIAETRSHQKTLI